MLEKIVDKKKELDNKELKKVAGGSFDDCTCALCGMPIISGETYCNLCKEQLGLG